VASVLCSPAVPRNSNEGLRRTVKLTSVPARIFGIQLCQVSSKASSEGAGSRDINRATVGVAARKASGASSPINDFKSRRSDDNDTELRSTALSLARPDEGFSSKRYSFWVALHMSAAGRYCCKSLFASLITKFLSRGRVSVQARRSLFNRHDRVV
jgi:hypothetical protein